ncbi:GntR family transcriptional regulator [Pseudovibrio sp. Tun.PSC04-5.I4]|uniref:GntR family transcriptional regulator n=1 Tax=Pseudovibrio sp. Tun.PSC04-5.I4 TaxID=1798213 RepID=UPI00087F07C4|nr:GntR family transcriptional regulator [Pseudovibrio sp. Tun.PSC04-5.I4]SDQ17009.1 DNA-binding transcriptional regulator, GntR family [Pseudovibrio sp. Tun.PSC04-5.I4]
MPRTRSEEVSKVLLDTFDETMIDRSIPIGPQIYELLRLKIVLMELPPESQINEHELARVLGVSRTPLRQAYQKLAGEGLIISRPQVGSIVAPIDQALIKEGIVIRRALEREVVQVLCSNKTDLSMLEPILAMQEIAVRKRDYISYFKFDEEFHKTLAYASGIPAAWRLALSVKGHADRARLSLMSKNKSRLERAYNEHIALIAAIDSGANKKAETIMNQHVNAVLEAIEK